MMKTVLSDHDYELITAYLDRELGLVERARFEERMERDPLLRKTTAELGQTRHLLRMLPALRAPRAFTLTPEMAGRRAGGLARFFDALSLRSLQYGAALSALLLALVFAGDLISAPASPQQTNYALDLAPMQAAPALEEAASAPLEEYEEEGVLLQEAAPAEALAPSPLTAPLSTGAPPAGTPTPAIMMGKAALETPAGEKAAVQAAEAQDERMETAAPGMEMESAAVLAPEGPPADGAAPREMAPEAAAQTAPDTGSGETLPEMAPAPIDQYAEQKPPARWGWRLAEIALGALCVVFLLSAWVAARQRRGL